VSVWGVTMVKDEADVIERTLRHMHAEGLAGVIALDNASADGTRGILDELAGELSGWLRVVDDPEVGYYQSAKMTAAARMAAERGASWIIPFDADEIWTADTDRSLADTILLAAGEDAELSVQYAHLFDHYPTGYDEGDWDADTDDPFTRMQWRRPAPLPLPKVAVRASTLRRIDYGNHAAEVSGGHAGIADLRVHHFPWRSPQQALRKVTNGSRAYKATDLPSTYGLHWRQMGEALDEHGPDAIRVWFMTGFYYDHPAESGLVWDPAPMAVSPS
jgi:Glycosyl transferase family 2